MRNSSRMNERLADEALAYINTVDFLTASGEEERMFVALYEALQWGELQTANLRKETVDSVMYDDEEDEEVEKVVNWAEVKEMLCDLYPGAERYCY